MDAAEQRRIRREARQARIKNSQGDRMAAVSAGMSSVKAEPEPSRDTPSLIESTAQVPTSHTSGVNITPEEKTELMKEQENLLKAFISASMSATPSTVEGSDGLRMLSDALDTESTRSKSEVSANLKAPGGIAGLETLYKFSTSDFMNKSTTDKPKGIATRSFLHAMIAVLLATLFLFLLYQTPREEDDDSHIWVLHRLLFESSLDVDFIPEWATNPLLFFVLNETVFLSFERLRRPKIQASPHELHLFKIFKFASDVYSIFSTFFYDFTVFFGVFLMAMMSPLLAVRFATVLDIS
eukprot:CFRG7890T1